MRKKGFSLVESLVVIAIIVVIVGLAIVNTTNKKRVILRTESEKVFKFLKMVQVNATRFSPNVLNAPENPDNNLFLQPANFRDPQPTNQFFEIRTFRLSMVDFLNQTDPVFQPLNNMNLAELDRSVVVNFQFSNGGNINGSLNVFPVNDIPNNPISLIAAILVRNNNRVFIGFRTDGRIVLPGGQINPRTQLSIRLSIRGLRRRQAVILPNESIRFEIYSEANN